MFRGRIPTAHTLAYLRIAESVTELVARLATDLWAPLWSGGLRTRWTTNRISRSYRILRSFRTSIDWSLQRVAPTGCPIEALTRSVLGDFHHTALPLNRLAATSPYLDQDTGSRERKVAKQVREPLPGQAAFLAATAEPFPPTDGRLVGEASQTSMVAVHSKVIEVTLKPL